MKSYLLVFIQFACIIYLGLTGPVLPGQLFLLILELTGLGLGFWAILTMLPGRFNIRPNPHPDTRIKTRGPYRFIRHPMYTAVLLVTLAWLLANVTWLRLMVWLILFGDLLWKLNYEEHLLRQKFKEYREYQQRTHRLLPFVY